MSGGGNGTDGRVVVSLYGDVKRLCLVKELTEMYEKLVTLKRVAVRLHRRHDSGELFQYACEKIAYTEERVRQQQQQFQIRDDEVRECVGVCVCVFVSFRFVLARCFVG